MASGDERTRLYLGGDGARWRDLVVDRDHIHHVGDGRLLAYSGHDLRSSATTSTTVVPASGGTTAPSHNSGPRLRCSPVRHHDDGVDRRRRDGSQDGYDSSGRHHFQGAHHFDIVSQRDVSSSDRGE
jgi:hypothetical protein